MLKTAAGQQTKTTNFPVVSQTPYIYRVVIEPDADRFYAEIPSLSGCYSWGYTYLEALKNIKESLELYLEVAAEDGRPIPVEDPQTIKQAAITVGVIV